MARALDRAAGNTGFSRSNYQGAQKQKQIKRILFTNICFFLGGGDQFINQRIAQQESFDVYMFGTRVLRGNAILLTCLQTETTGPERVALLITLFKKKKINFDSYLRVCLSIP